MKSIREAYGLAGKVVDKLRSDTPADLGASEFVYALANLQVLFAHFLLDADHLAEAVQSGDAAKAKYLAKRIKDLIAEYDG